MYGSEVMVHVWYGTMGHRTGWYADIVHPTRGLIGRVTNPSDSADTASVAAWSMVAFIRRSGVLS